MKTINDRYTFSTQLIEGVIYEIRRILQSEAFENKRKYFFVLTLNNKLSLNKLLLIITLRKL